MTPRSAFDVVVVGASIAGCTAARLYALGGASVALLERRPDPDAYKVTCTHAVLSSAAPTIERLGLASLLAERGAVRARAAAWTPYGGWLPAPDDAPRGWGVTRRTLDPMLRALAANTPGVELIAGEAATRLIGDNGRPAGVEMEGPSRRPQAIRARLVVGADGRNSTVARLACMPGRVRPNNRFAYFAYWRGVRPQTDRARIWFLDPDVGASFPNEDDLTVIAAAPHRSRLAEFRANPERAYERMVTALPDAPDIGGAKRVSKLKGKLDTPNVSRPPSRPGVALVGDAALGTDPTFGVGCGWAFQTAEWLVDRTAPALLGDGDLDAALRRYRRDFRRRLGPEHFLICDFSTGRPLRAFQRMLFRAAATDSVVARTIEEVATRRRSSLSMFDPRVAARTARAVLSRP